jgi:hypothetical protein
MLKGLSVRDTVRPSYFKTAAKERDVTAAFPCGINDDGAGRGRGHSGGSPMISTRGP